MKNPIYLWKDLTPIGKVFSWWIMPMYYISTFILFLVGILFYGIYAAWSDYGD